MSMHRDVFLSHSSSDREAAQRIRAFLESHGISCWIAPRDIPAGRDWVEAIIDGIEVCSSILLIVSAESNKSPQVRRELEMAVSRGLTLVSVLIEDVQLSKWMQYYISTRQWYDATGGDLSQHLFHLLEALSPGEAEVFADLSNISSLLEKDIGRLASAIEYGKVGAEILETGERRKATVLHLCVRRPFAEKSELPPEALATMQETTGNMVRRVVEAYGGTYEPLGRFDYRGIFGLRRALEDDGQRAVSSAVRLFNGFGELNRVIRKRGLALEFGMGAASGILRISEKKLGEFTVFGDPLEEAESLAENLSHNELVVSEDVFRSCRHRFAFERIESGPGPVCYRLDDYTMAPVDGRSLQVRSPLIGRDRELSVLANLLARQREGTGRNRRGGAIHLVQGIRGDVGLGKSRLVHEFKKEYCEARDDIRVLEGHTLSFAQPPYWLWADLLQRLLEIDEENAPDYGRLMRRLEDLGADEDLLQSAPFLARALSIDCGDPSISQLDGKTVALETKVAFSALLETLAQSKKLVVILEDLQRIDGTCRDVLEFVIGNCDSSTPIVFLLVYRPEREDGEPAEFTIHPGYAMVKELVLSELDEASSKRLLKNLLSSLGGTDRISDRIVSFVMSCSRGNPLFLEEMVLDLVESEALGEDGGRWSFDRPLEEVFVPTTLTGLLQSRLDKLPAEWRRELQNMSVLGMEFSQALYGEFARMLHDGVPDQRLLEDLERKGFLTCSRGAFERKYGFGNKLIHDVAYNSILESNLKLLHAAAARALEKLHSEDAGRFAGILTRHWEKAGDIGKTIEWGTKALEAAVSSYQNRTALYLSDKLEEWIGSQPEDQRSTEKLVDVLLKKAKVQALLGKTGTAEKTLTRALDMARREGLSEQECLGRIIHANNVLLTGHPGQARENLKRALELSREIPNRRMESLALIGFGGLGLSESDLEDALKYYSRAEEISREMGDRENEGGCLVNQGIVHHTRGMLDRALENYRRAQEIFDQTHNRKSSASNLINMGILHFNQDRMEEARECYDQALGLMRRIGFRRGEGHALVNLGIIHRCEGEFDDSMDRFAQALQIHRETGNRSSEILALINLAELQLKMGEPEKALSSCTQALEASREIRSRRLEGHTLSELGETYRVLDRLDEAEKCLRDSLGILRELGDKKQVGAALRRMGLLRCEQGRFEQALECYGESVGIIEDLKAGIHDSEELLQLRQKLRQEGTPQDELRLPGNWKDVDKTP